MSISLGTTSREAVRSVAPDAKVRYEAQRCPLDEHLYTAVPFPSGGSKHCRDIQKLQSLGWKRVQILSSLPYMMVVILILYFLGILAGRVPDLPSRSFIFYSILTVCIPQINFAKAQYFSRTFSAAAILVLVYELEEIMQRKQCLVSLLALFLLSRMFQHKTFYDNVAICMAYSVTGGALNSKSSSWYYTSNFLLWAYLLIAMLLLYVYKRLWHRIWEHVRILLILTEKLKREDHIGRAIIAAHIPRDIQAHIFPTQADVSVENALRSGKCFLQNSERAHEVTVQSPQQKTQVVTKPAGATTETLRAAAVEAGLLTDFSDAQLTLAQLQSLGGLDRRDCALITIGFDGGVGEEAVHGTRQQQCMHRMLDKLAVEHRITCVRKFGNVWIGCVGFFKTWESQYINCYEAVLFASEVSLLENSANMTFAVDCGTVTGGFLRSLNFDFFGQEIRWLLMALELKLHGKVIVGDAVKKMLKAHQQKCPEMGGFRFLDKTVPLAWRVGSHIVVGLVDNVSDVVSLATMTELLSRHATEAAGSKTPEPIEHDSVGAFNWQVVRDLLGEDTAAASFGDHRRDILRPWKRSAPDMWQISDSQASLDQEIGEEFLLTATQRFQQCLNDPVLDGYTDQQLHDAHVCLETQLFAVIRKVCFPSASKFLNLQSTFLDATGRNEYKSVLSYADEGWLTVFGGIGQVPFPIRRAGEFLFSWLYPAQDMKLTPVDERKPALQEKPQPTRSGLSFPREHKYRAVRVVPAAERILEADEEQEQAEELEKEVPSLPTSAPNASCDMSPLFQAERQNSDGFASAGESEPPRKRGSSPDSSTYRRDECARGWYKYAGDARMFFLSERVNSAVTAVFYFVLMCGANVYVRHGYESSGHSTFLCGVALHMWVMVLLERRYDPYFAWIILVLDIITLSALTFGYECGTSALKSGSAGESLFGDKGGEVASLLTTVILIPFHMRQPAFFSFWNSFMLVLVVIVRKVMVRTECGNVAQYRILMVYIFVILCTYYWALEHFAFGSYLLEHKLLPAAVRNYRKQKDNTRALLQAFAPRVPVSSSCELYVQKPFRDAAVAALHVKVADQIAHFMDPRELSLILHRIHRVVEKSVVECGMLSVTHFSGVYLAVACRDSTWDSVESLRFPDSHTARAVVFLRNVRGRLSALSRELQFNIHMGIGIDQGAVQLGFLGQERFNFDVSGPVRDLAVTMASFHTDGSFASEAFEPDIRKMQAPEDLVRDVSKSLDLQRRRETRWLRIDGSFNGIQLEDFKYLCLLGQGGYGSVHLLAEKHTGVPYAIKAIELKQESKLSKMIERECSILQMVQHPNVVNLKYSFRNHNRLYLVMSYIRGGNLKQVVERDKLGLAHMLMWFAELVLAIEYLHSLGIIHRDVKPVNCMIGTDGHLKLGDFGLSKVVDSPLMERRDVKATDRYVDSLGLQSESMQKVRKFLPLKLDAAQREEQQAEITAHRTVKVLLITMDDSKADSTLLFINTTVEVSIADYDIDSDTIKLNQFEAIFIDGDYYEEDSPELVAHFCSHIFNCLPVLLCAKSEDLRKRGLASGARACSRLPLEALTEDTFDSIFTSTAIGADPVHKYREDLIRLQEEKIAKLLAREAALVSQYEKGLTRNADATRSARGGALEGGGDTLLTVSNSQRDSVRVESKSHSIVGTLYFIAPEVIRLRRYGKAVDWWACGITIYQCLVRNHLFEGRDKKETMENIMNAPIVLDELAPYGDAATSLIRGLLNRDNKRRLGSGSQGAQSIKSHKLFEKIDWATVSTSNPVHKPAQFVNKKFRADDRSLFYGPRRDNDVMPWSDQSTDLGSASMRKYISNKKRARQSGGGGSNSSWSGRVNRTLLSVLIANSGSIGKNT